MYGVGPRFLCPRHILCRVHTLGLRLLNLSDQGVGLEEVGGNARQISWYTVASDKGEEAEEELRKALIMTFPELPRSVIPESVSLQRSRRRSLLVWAVEEMSRKVKLNEDDDVPGVYNVVVDPNKCVLCGVCVRACQMLVPDLTGGEELALSYNIPYCIGSQRCVKNCPENAVSVPGLAKIRDLTRKVMNRGKVIQVPVLR